MLKHQTKKINEPLSYKTDVDKATYASNMGTAGTEVCFSFLFCF